MIDIDVIIKSLRLAWIPRLFQNNKSNWKTDPKHFLRRCGGWSLLSVKVQLPYKASSKPTKFQKDAFSSSPNKNNCNFGKESILFNNQDILIEGKPILFLMSGSQNVLSVKNLLHGLGRYLTFQELLPKYNCNLSFLEYYQVSSAIPNFFLSARGGITLHAVEGFVQGASISEFRETKNLGTSTSGL